MGTGKTHLAASVGNYLMSQGVPVVFGTIINLLGKLKQSYTQKGQDEGEILELYSTIDLLIIDDLGKERPTEWSLEKLYTIINDRYENLKPVIITTNYNNDMLTDRLSTANNSSTAEAITSKIS